jgi:iron complex outermembrane recepter protein
MKIANFLTQLFSVIFICNSFGFSVQAEEEKDEEHILKMKVEDFFDLYQNIYSIARKNQKLKNASSAIHVLTQEDIKRSGATILPDVLRLVPGVQVAKIGSNNWAVTIRGANQLYNQKILVLIDNVPIVTPLFNGIFWEALNMPLESIEKIEVIRGPGAAVWGARAVNGVINIITKSGTSQSSQASVAVGSYHTLSTHMLHNQKIDDDNGLNLYVKYDQFDNSQDLEGVSINDSWDVISLGGRGDFKLNEKNSFRVSNNTFYKDEATDRNFPIQAEGFNDRIASDRYHLGSLTSFLWSNKINPDSDFSVQWSNYFENLNDLAIMDYSIYQSDLDIRYRFKPIEKHEVVSGASVVLYRDHIRGTQFVDFNPGSRSLEFYRGFIHDEIELLEDELFLTLGSRFEYNTQIGFSIMPTVRTSYSINKSLSVWGAVSYTEGTASRINDDITLPVASFREPTTGLPAIAQVVGNRNGQSENLTAYEIGLRAEPKDSLFFDITGFYFNNRKVISRETGEAELRFNEMMMPSHLVIPLRYDNIPVVDSYGTELSANWKFNDMFRLAGSYSFITSSVSPNGSNDSVAFDFNDNNPSHMLAVRLHLDPMENIQCDAILRYVDTLRKTNVSSYTELDLRANWKLTPKFSLSVIGRDLLNNGHQEFQAWTFNQPLSRVRRSVFTQLAYSF